MKADYQIIKILDIIIIILYTLHIIGFTNPSLATILYHLGPNSASSNRDGLLTIRRKYNLGIPDDKHVPSDTTIIPTNPVTDREIEKLLEVFFIVYIEKCEWAPS